MKIDTGKRDATMQPSRSLASHRQLEGRKATGRVPEPRTRDCNHYVGQGILGRRELEKAQVQHEHRCPEVVGWILKKT